MPGNLSIESIDFDAIRRGDDEATANAMEFIWLALNDEAKRRRQGVRLAVDRSEWATQIESPTATMNDFEIGDVSTLRFDGSDAEDLTGILAPSAGSPRLLLILVLGSGTITLKHDNAGSEEPNRILTQGAGDVAITTNRAVALLYQNSRWRELKWM